jgi:GTP-binding protein HflX
MDIARIMGEISRDINRQIGILMDRTGHITHVMVGDHSSIEIPHLDRLRSTGNRLRGLRLIHTHLNEEKLSEEDLADLVLLRLDYITAVIPDETGMPKYFFSAHTNAEPESDLLWVILDKEYPGQLRNGFLEEVQALEFNLSKFKNNLKESSGKNRAFLIGVHLNNKKHHRSIESSILELKELCRTAEIHVVDSFYQRKNSLDAATVIGTGKIKEILLKAVQKEVELLVFDLDLSPSQAKKISDYCDLKVIDRTQLILDIFARNAKSRDGKLQVELAQLKYLKGRLSELDDNMSRLTGGIGGRGPGETKLEIGKRRVEEKISRLEKELKSLRQRRELNRKKRKRNEVPVVAIVGYTNAGKSTLLNVLTNSDVIAENKLFATLDPTTRRIRFPEEREIILSDTVGFIHDLPPDLTNAFKATLEELGDADLLLHVIDISNPIHNEQVQSVENILSSLDLQNVKRINVYNKMDVMEEGFKVPDDGIGISTINKNGLEELLDEIENALWE